MILKEHEKFWAFLTLVLSVMGLASAAIIWPVIHEGTQRVIDAALGGLLLALGVAGNALFRIREESDKVTTTTTTNGGSSTSVSTTGSTGAGAGELSEAERVQ